MNSETFENMGLKKQNYIGVKSEALKLYFGEKSLLWRKKPKAHKSESKFSAGIQSTCRNTKYWLQL